MKQPSRSMTANITASMTSGASLNPVAQPIRPLLAPENASSWLNVDDAKMMSRSIPVTLIADSAAGLLMSRGEIDAAIVGELLVQLAELLAPSVQMALHRALGHAHVVGDAGDRPILLMEEQDDLALIVKRVDALGAFLQTDDGANLLAGVKRASMVLLLARELLFRRDWPASMRGLHYAGRGRSQEGEVKVATSAISI